MAQTLNAEDAKDAEEHLNSILNRQDAKMNTDKCIEQGELLCAGAFNPMIEREISRRRYIEAE